MINYIIVIALRKLRILAAIFCILLTSIKLVEVSQLHFDRDFKNVFQQENDKVTEIANDMIANGFDKSRPIIVTEAYIIVDGHSRFMAAKKAGLEKVPVIIKKFESRDETIEYEYKMCLKSKNR